MCLSRKRFKFDIHNHSVERYSRYSPCIAERLNRNQKYGIAFPPIDFNIFIMACLLCVYKHVVRVYAMKNLKFD